MRRRCSSSSGLPLHWSPSASLAAGVVAVPDFDGFAASLTGATDAAFAGASFAGVAAAAVLAGASRPFFKEDAAEGASFFSATLEVFLTSFFSEAFSTAIV
jgi:hypothetical protein